MTTNTSYFHSWDDTTMAEEVLRRIQGIDRVPLPSIDPPSQPGTYVVWLGSTRPELHEVFGSLIARGEVPVYAGCGQRLRARVFRYRQSLRRLAGIDLSELYVGLLPCATHASAAFTERVLLDRTSLLFADLGGFGAKVPGSRRTEQAASALDSLLFLGRGWTRRPSPVDMIRARAQVLAHLARLDPAGPRWPSLV